MNAINNNIIKQVVLLLIIAFLGIIIIWKLSYFIPGMLGATALYILFRTWYFRLITKRKWKPSWAALAIIFGIIVAFVIPIYFIGQMLAPKVQELIANSDQIKAAVLETYAYVQKKFPQIKINNSQLASAAQNILSYVPSLFNAAAQTFANIFTALFIVYFMFVGGRYMEKEFKTYVPLARTSRVDLWTETKNLVVSNAVGIPVLAIIQGLIAMIGYWVCGVPGFLMWGILTGLASMIPVVGTMVIWVPICIYLFAQGKVEYGIGLALYCFIVVGSSDNIVRFTLLKRFGDVHPLITVFGVVLGLNVFGIMGLIFGPLLLSYFIMLIKVYSTEFSDDNVEGNKD